MRNKRNTGATTNGKEEKEEEKKKQKQQNGKNRNAMKKETEVVVLESSSSDSEEERNEGQEEEEEEEAKSSNNSNNSNLAPKEDEEDEEEEEEEKAAKEEEEENGIKRKKILSNGVAVSGCFPTHRIKRMIRSEGDFRTTGEAIFLINKATEKFLESLAEDAYACSAQDHKKSINYKHLSSVVSKTKRYDFLSDFVPEKVRAEDALEERRLAGT
ncbi:DNA polymerase epsilon subunit C [Macadamia integrifolia]|uniref:DNA polymerase epsilon subunit C n=1 Tax=Macadamia integrifolia TaxID=60698 RepID=UPI001C4EF09E|nr:DNA polymerase epsilon subunit C [Macadamia integrifolia]